MNEFELYQQLKEIESIAGQYTSGKAFIPEIKKAADSISSREYRVAVIGEFKRGKSSLVNAIIGSEVLPTDILPMTAAITRVTYGTERKILIRYKDGHTEENTVAQLMEYATKYDEQKAKRAAAVEEIEVSYPSPFLKNHIDIIDTPGLNDTDKMTEVTLSVLGGAGGYFCKLPHQHDGKESDYRPDQSPSDSSSCFCNYAYRCCFIPQITAGQAASVPYGAHFQ